MSTEGKETLCQALSRTPWPKEVRWWGGVGVNETAPGGGRNRPVCGHTVYKGSNEVRCNQYGHIQAWNKTWMPTRSFSQLDPVLLTVPLAESHFQKGLNCACKRFLLMHRSMEFSRRKVIPVLRPSKALSSAHQQTSCVTRSSILILCICSVCLLRSSCITEL